jgi:hypothetical protein
MRSYGMGAKERRTVRGGYFLSSLIEIVVKRFSFYGPPNRLSTSVMRRDMKIEYVRLVFSTPERFDQSAA